MRSFRAIRKHGVYITDEKLKLFAEHPELLDALMKSLYAAHAGEPAAQAERQTLLPKADYYDAFMDADGCTNLRTTAKELNVPERWFARFLQQTGFLYRSPAGNLMPYAIPRNRGAVPRAGLRPQRSQRRVHPHHPHGQEPVPGAAPLRRGASN